MQQLKKDTFLSFQFSEIGKILGNNLHSKDESLQEESIRALKIVSSKCSTLASIEFFVRHFCKIYNGSEGKLAVQSQKYSVLKAIGLASFNGLTEPTEKQSIFNLAINELISILKQEATEANTVVVFSQVQLWITNSPGCELPENFWKFVKDFRKGKLATSLTITSLYSCLNCYVLNFTEVNGKLLDEDILSALMNSSRNLTSSIAKMNVLTESLHSSVVLLNIHKRDQSLGKFP